MRTVFEVVNYVDSIHRIQQLISIRIVLPTMPKQFCRNGWFLSHGSSAVWRDHQGCRTRGRPLQHAFASVHVGVTSVVVAARTLPPSVSDKQQYPHLPVHTAYSPF